MHRIALTIAAISTLAGCSYDYDTIRPDIAPGTEHSITIVGDGLDVIDLYDGPPTIYGDGVECDYTVTITDTSVRVDVACYPSAATTGLIPSRILDVMDGDILHTRIVLDGRR